MSAPLSGETVQTLLVRAARAVGRASRRLGGDLDNVIVAPFGRLLGKLDAAPLGPDGRARLTRAEVGGLLTDALVAVTDAAKELETAGHADMAATVWNLAVELVVLRAQTTGVLVLVCREHGEYKFPLPLDPSMKGCPQC